MNTDLMFSSATDQWATPQQFFNDWAKLFPFTLDVCADASNAKCPRYFDREADGLRQDWAPETCWMNPPYGREIGRWVRKAYEESQKGATVVCLLPARTDTAWWHDYVIEHAQVAFIRGRIKFGDAKTGAPFPSAVAVFYPAVP
jgi:site-specific DNA-methyltransferase (adenine-specific)